MGKEKSYESINCSERNKRRKTSSSTCGTTINGALGAERERREKHLVIETFDQAIGTGESGSENPCGKGREVKKVCGAGIASLACLAGGKAYFKGGLPPKPGSQRVHL